MRLKALLAVSLVLVLGAALISGCCIPTSCSDQLGEQIGKEVEKKIEEESGVDVETEDTAETSGKDLESVPRYPDSKRTFYIKGEPVDGNVSISITYETSDSPSDVVAWYKEKMAGLGWTVSSTIGGTDGGEMITYDKGDNNTTATINVTKDGNKATITIMYNGVESGA